MNHLYYGDNLLVLRDHIASESVGYWTFDFNQGSLVPIRDSPRVAARIRRVLAADLVSSTPIRFSSVNP